MDSRTSHIRPDDFFTESQFQTGRHIDYPLLRAVRAGALGGRDDTEVAAALARLVSNGNAPHLAVS